MNRRDFLQTVAASTALSLDVVPTPATTLAQPTGDPVAEFTDHGVAWKVFEDLAQRDGAITFVSSQGKRVMSKNVEAAFAEADPPYLGLKIADIGMSGPDLLADELLKHGGDPDEARVRAAAPPLGSNTGGQQRPSWNTFLGTKECFDTMPVFPGGNTRTYHPSQYFTELRQQGVAQKRYEGMLGGWMPAVRKVFPLADGAHLELIVFGDVDAKDKFIVQTWHRSAKIENGKMTKVVYGYSYPAYPPARVDPQPVEFYRALLRFHTYWEKQLHDVTPISLPNPEWTNMAKHAVAKEIMVRPGGVYPKYGAVAHLMTSCFRQRL